MALTDMEIRAAKPGARLVKLSDGGGLQLWITADGAKRWRLAYRFADGQKLLAIGVYPAIGLREAREAREEAKRILASGQDPSLAKKLAKAAKAIASANTFDAIGAGLLEKKRRERKAERTIVKFEWFLKLARPAIGARPIAEITAPEILAILRPIEARGRHETAKKLRGAIGQVFRFAIATGRAESDPTSVERIFSVHIDLLKIPYVHGVFTVPPWLKFVLPGTVQITLLSTVHLWNNDPKRTRCEPAWEVFRSLIKRRLGEEGLQRLFGNQPERQGLVDRVIEVCGGHFRDLLRLLSETVLRGTSLTDLPVPLTLVENAIKTARRDFLPIAEEDAKWLAEIARVRATALPSTDPAPVNRLARFLDSHFVLYFINGDEWYDIHPLIRDEVAEVVQASASSRRQPRRHSPGKPLGALRST